MPKNLAVFAPEIHPPFIEGVQKTAWAFVQSFAQKGVQVTVYTERSFGEEFSGPLPDGISVENVFSTHPIRPLKYLLWIAQSVRLATRMKREKPDHVLVFSLDLPVFVVLKLLLIFITSVPVTLAIFSIREVEGVGKFFLKFLGRRFAQIIVRSECLKNRVMALGIPGDRMHIELPFPHKERFVAPVSREKGDLPTVAYLSNVDEDAGISTVLEAARMMPDYRFIVAVRRFSDAYEAEVERFIARVTQSGLANIVIERTIADIPAFLRQADVVLLPVVDERSTMDMPMVLIEALAVGTPVIVRRLPIFETLIKQGIVGSFVTMHDLATAVRQAVPSQRGVAFARSLPTMGESVQTYLTLMHLV